jgi:hypothetical protein
VRPVRRFHEGYQMNDEDEEEKPAPADGQLVWAVVGVIVLLLGFLTLRSCL